MDVDITSTGKRRSSSGISRGSPIQEVNPTEVQALATAVLPRRNRSKNIPINFDLDMETDWGDEALKDQAYGDTATAKCQARVKKQAVWKSGEASTSSEARISSSAKTTSVALAPPSKCSGSETYRAKKTPSKRPTVGAFSFTPPSNSSPPAKLASGISGPSRPAELPSEKQKKPVKPSPVKNAVKPPSLADSSTEGTTSRSERRRKVKNGKGKAATASAVTAPPKLIKDRGPRAFTQKQSKTRNRKACSSRTQQPEYFQNPPEDQQGILDTSAYMDGLTVWINHSTLQSPNPFEVCEAVLAVAQAKHPNASLLINSVSNGGKHATIIRCATEPVRRLFTDHHLGATLQVDDTNHHLQIQSYRGGGNRLFFLSGCKIHTEAPMLVARAIKAAYKGLEFELFQCVWHGIKADCFFVQFGASPAKLTKEIPLELEKLGGGLKAWLLPVDINGKCRNPACRGKDAGLHQGSCPNTVLVSLNRG